MATRPKPVIILEALLAGQTFDFEGHKWGMAEDGSLCVIPESGLEDGKGMAVDTDIRVFCSMANRMPDDLVFVIGAEKALSDINRAGGPSKSGRKG